MADAPCQATTKHPFLTASWRWLAMLNYEVDPQILAPRVPRGTELDFEDGKTYLSLVGFRFLDTRVLGCRVPFHRNFEEVNLRFYVRRIANGEMRRGVVFIKEIVPRWAIAAVARSVYNEQYVAVPMRHATGGFDGAANPVVHYDWNMSGKWNRLAVTCRSEWATIAEGSHEEFITEHYWGYCRQRDGGTIEYRVAHPRWRVYLAESSSCDCDVANVYGPEFVEFLRETPASAFVAAGSEVAVYKPERLP